MANAYPWIKAVHVIFIVSWMAGLLYLPRLFVYHAASQRQTPQYDLLLTMERRLIHIILNPAAVLSCLSGASLMGLSGEFLQKWLHAKIFLVFLLLVVHCLMVYWYTQFKLGECGRSSTFFRCFNEVPTLLMIGIVILVIVKPF